MDDTYFMNLAIEEAKKGLATGGIPIGSILVKNNQVIGRGHNRRVQHGSVIHHGEMNCLENAGRLTAKDYKECTIYTTLSPCPMCSGAILLYKIPRVVIGENRTFMGDEEHLKSKGVSLTLMDSPECFSLMQDFIQKNPTLWDEDIAV
ncbi:MAG: nucleoside deaminase [Alphaproteobacteria bacterium]|nr:nucleoside deaminase [Alphaproteobacteria bacterium]